MAYQASTQFITIPLSSAVSGAWAIKDSDLMALWMPVCTSGSWTLQGAFQTGANSADFLPIINSPPNSGPVTLWLGAGSLSVALHTFCAPFSALRLVGSNPQAAVRSLAIVTKA